MKTDFVAATERYESWLRSQIEAQQADFQVDELDYKHVQMAAKESPFPFFRGTYYRWAEIWPGICEDCQSAPRVLAVGDLHVANFGTWRDREARLVWGVNDFDEADDLPFTNDLVRLAASTLIGADTAKFGLSFKKSCRAILLGYVEQLERRGQPFVLEEEHAHLRNLATQADRDPVVFWKKLTEVLKDTPPEISPDVESALKKDLHSGATKCEIRRRTRVGMGSLGKPRFVALACLTGAWAAREVKSLTPPATALLNADSNGVSRLTDIVSRAVRCPDPLLRVEGAWIVRRLAPRCSRIEMAMLTKSDDERRMFEAMGAETANVHAGSPDARESILRWLDAQPEDWLADAARKMTDATRDDWKAWRKHFKKQPQPV